MGQPLLLVDGEALRGRTGRVVSRTIGTTQPDRLVVAGDRPVVDAYVVETLRRLLE